MKRSPNLAALESLLGKISGPNRMHVLVGSAGKESAACSGCVIRLHHDRLNKASYLLPIYIGIFELSNLNKRDQPFDVRWLKSI